MKRALIRRSPRVPLFNDPAFRSFDRLLNGDLFEPFLALRGEDTHGASWAPPVDVQETDEAYVFHAELPGLTKDDVSITLEERILTLSGERKFEETTEKNGYHRVERAYGNFTRSFSLPSEVAQEKVGAKFANGVLTITVPKAEQAKPRTIEIH